MILAALYLLWAYQRVFHGEPDEANKSFPELTLKEGRVLLPFLGRHRVHGRVPEAGARSDRAEHRRLISHVEDHTDYVEPEPTIQIGEHDAAEPAHGDEEPAEGEQEGDG